MPREEKGKERERGRKGELDKEKGKREICGRGEGRDKVRERKQQVSPVARRKSIPNYAPALGAKRDKNRVDYIFV